MSMIRYVFSNYVFKKGYTLAAEHKLFPSIDIMFLPLIVL